LIFEIPIFGEPVLAKGTRSTKRVFGSVVVVAFQIAFRAEIHANDVFLFFKIIFDISTSKRSKKYKPHSILAKKKKN
jgi:hypothetical protein